MIVTLANQNLIDKIAELCNEVLQQEAYHSLRAMVEQFINDEEAVQQYERFLKHQQMLEYKEAQHKQLSAEEISEYEQEELAIYNNPTIRKYLYAEQEFGKFHRLMSQFYTKTIELQRLPQLNELKKEGCGCGGSCGGH